MERQKFSFTAEERLQRQGQASATDIADLIVIGASAGGHRALREILGNFSTEIPATIVILLHQVLNSPGSLNKTLGQFSRLPVIEVEIRSLCAEDSFLFRRRAGRPL